MASVNPVPRVDITAEFIMAPHGRRAQLRAAYDMLDTIGMGGFAERAQRDLLATRRDGVQAQKSRLPAHSPRRRPPSPCLRWPGALTQRSAPRCSSAHARTNAMAEARPEVDQSSAQSSRQ